MRTMTKRTAAGAVLGGALMFTGGLGIASAAPVGDINDGLVNLGVGNVNLLTNVDSNVASQVASLLCGTPTTDLGVRTDQVDAGSTVNATCDSAQGVVTISQNGPANSPNPEAGPLNAPNAGNTPARSGAHAGSAEVPAQSPALVPGPQTPIG